MRTCLKLRDCARDVGSAKTELRLVVHDEGRVAAALHTLKYGEGGGRDEAEELRGQASGGLKQKKQRLYSSTKRYVY